MTFNPGDVGHLAEHDRISQLLTAPGIAPILATVLSDPTSLPVQALDGQFVRGNTSGDEVDHFSTAWTGRQWDVRLGTAGTPTAGGGPGIKISQTENITNLSQVGGNPGDNEANAALHVAVESLPGSLAQANAILATAKGAPVGTDVLAFGAWGRVTGGVGTGFGAYLEGRRDVASAHAIGAEIRVQNEGGADGTLNPNGASDTLGVWVSTSGTGGHKASAGVSLGTADDSQFLAGYHVTSYSVSGEAFRDESGSTASFQSRGTHDMGLDLGPANFTGYAIQLPAGTDSHSGISFGNDAFLYRDAAGRLRLVGALSVSGAITSDKSSGWVALTLGSSWQNYGGAETVAAYRRMADGTVRLRGSIKSGTTGTAIFTLPAGFRPAVSSREVFMAIGGPGVCEIDVGSDGVVKVAQYIASGSNSFVSLAGITFTTD